MSEAVRCDVCGLVYNSSYVSAHKRRAHPEKYAQDNPAIDEAEVALGLAGAAKALAALEALASSQAFLVGPQPSLADFHLGAMIAYFTAAPEGAAMLSGYRRLAGWWERLGARPSLAATAPGLPVTQV